VVEKNMSIWTHWCAKNWYSICCKSVLLMNNKRRWYNFKIYHPIYPSTHPGVWNFGWPTIFCWVGCLKFQPIGKASCSFLKFLTVNEIFQIFIDPSFLAYFFFANPALIIVASIVQRQVFPTGSPLVHTRKMTKTPKKEN
jgi:hypothetical protein